MAKINTFKIGDKVRCVSLGRIVGHESKDWARIDGLLPGKIYTVRESFDDRVKIEEGRWRHLIHHEHFEHADCRKSEENKEFKVGDKVLYLGNLIGIIGCIHGGFAFMSSCIDRNSGNKKNYPAGGICEEHKNFMGFYLDSLVKIKDDEVEPANFSTTKINVVNSLDDIPLSCEQPGKIVGNSIYGTIIVETINKSIEDIQGARSSSEAGIRAKVDEVVFEIKERKSIIKPKKFMSLVNKIRKSELQKAFEHFGYKSNDGGLTDTGAVEFSRFVYTNGGTGKEFDALVLQEYKKEIKDK